MITLNKRMYEAVKFGLGGGTPKAPKPPAPPPTADDAVANVSRGFAQKKVGRQSTILAGGTLGGSTPAQSNAKTLLGY